MKRRDTQRTGGDESGLLGDCRGANEIIGYAVLIGILSVTIAIIGFGGGAESLLALQQQPVESSGQQAMSQLAAEMDAIALGAAGTRQVDIVPRTDSTRTVDPDAGNFTILVEEDGVVEHRSGPHDLGAVIFEHGGTEIAYQGGGVWQKSGERSLMIAEPPVSYNSQLGRESASLDVSLVSIAGDPRQTGETVQLTGRGATASEAFDFPVYENTTVTLQVNSEYVHGWADYFNEEFPGNVTDDDISGNTVNATFKPTVPGDSDVNPNEEFVDVDSNGTVDVTLLGSMVSRDTTEWRYVSGDWIEFDKSEWATVTAEVSVERDTDTETPVNWTDVYSEGTDEVGSRNLNTFENKIGTGDDDIPPQTAVNQFDREFDVVEGDNITIGTSFYSLESCNNEIEAIESGNDWLHESCAAVGVSSPELTVDATTNTNEGNVRVLTDGDLVPRLETDYRQPTIRQVFNNSPDVNINSVNPDNDDEYPFEIVTDESEADADDKVYVDNVSQLNIEENQAIFLFEVTDSNAQWNSADDIPEIVQGSGDPNFNDVVMLLEINDDASNVQTRVTVNSVSVE